MIFWDTSAIIPLLLDEPMSAAMRAEAARDCQLVVWWGTPVECASALARQERSGELARAHADRARASLTQLQAAWSVVAPADDLRDLAALLVRRHPLRAADALQLAAASVWAELRPAGHRIATLDDRLAEAARLEGFEVARGE